MIRAPASHFVLITASLVATVAALALFAPNAAAQTFQPDETNTFGGMTVQSAEVPSFDGTPIDVDVTLPLAGTGSRHPLIVLLHGFGNDKHEWQSTSDDGDGADKHHWNSRWFAKKGFYVLTYTARGFRTDPEARPDQPNTPEGSSASLPSGTIQLKTREGEIRDTRYLAALLAATFPDLDRDRVAVSGGSYGGGESWMHAAYPQWPALDGGDALEVKVVVPKYSWTDLAYGLAPSGHGPSPYEVAIGAGPVGAVKLSYVDGFFALGGRDGIFETGTRLNAPEEGTISIPGWRARLVDVGPPYPAADPIVEQARRGLTEFRSAYYQDDRFAAQAATGDEVAIFAAQGWTDDLFGSAEVFRQYLRLKELDPHWPVAVALGDVGHARAANPPETWRWLNSLANGFLNANLNDSTGAQSFVASERTNCFPGGDGARRVRARTPMELANGTFSRTFAGGLLPSVVADPDGVTTDPIVGPITDSIGTTAPGVSCRPSRAAAAPGRYTARTEPLVQGRTYVGNGAVTLDYALTGDVTATVAARLWDEAPDGTAVLIDRGVYRIDTLAGDLAAGTLELPLFGDHYRFAKGHRIRLDLTQVDTPTFRPDNPNPGRVVAFDSARLSLPVLEGTG